MKSILIISFIFAMLACEDEFKTQSQTSSPNLKVALSTSSTEEAASYAPGELIVAFQKETAKEKIDEILANHGLKLKETMPLENTFLVTTTEDVKSKMEELKQVSEIRYSEPNYTVSIDKK